MSAPINLSTIHQRIVCIQAECALWQIRREWEHLLATMPDETRRVQVAELLRVWHCEHPIRGARGYFAGCADGGGENKAFHQRDVLKMGGLKHEVDVHHQRARMKFASGQRQELRDLQDRLDVETRRLADQLGNTTRGSREWQSLTKELGTRVTEMQLVAAHLARAKPAKASSGRTKAAGGTKKAATQQHDPVQ